MVSVAVVVPMLEAARDGLAVALTRKMPVQVWSVHLLPVPFPCFNPAAMVQPEAPVFV